MSQLLCKSALALPCMGVATQTLKAGMWLITEVINCTTLMTHHWGTGDWGGRAEAIFCYFLEPVLEFSCISLYITIDISIFMCLESWSQDVEDSIVEEQCSLTALFRDFQHFRKMCIDQEFSYWWYFISRDGPISNILSQPNISAQLGKLLLASKGIESKANMQKDRGRSMMIFYQLPWVCVLTAESELLLANW